MVRVSKVKAQEKWRNSCANGVSITILQLNYTEHLCYKPFCIEREL